MTFYAEQDVRTVDVDFTFTAKSNLKFADTKEGFVFLSSRASYELVRKAARVDVPMLATISAPSSLAIAIARKAGVRLVSFCRETSYVDYDTAQP